MRLSPTLAASLGLVILAFAAPGKAHAEEALPPEPISAPRTEMVVPTTPPLEKAPEYEPYRQDPNDRDRYARWRLSGGFGVRFGSFLVNGDATGTAIPFHVEVGARGRRLYLFGSYELFSIDASVPSYAPDDAARAAAQTLLGDGSGLVHRAGATARYTVGRLGEHDGGLDVWTEAGLGVQHIRWDAGGVWTRPDVELGVGASVLYLGKDKHSGFSIGLRILLAPRNDGDGAPAVCGGPCDHPTPPSGTDRSFMFDMTMPIGL